MTLQNKKKLSFFEKSLGVNLRGVMKLMRLTFAEKYSRNFRICSLVSYDAQVFADISSLFDRWHIFLEKFKFTF